MFTILQIELKHALRCLSGIAELLVLSWDCLHQNVTRLILTHYSLNNILSAKEFSLGSRKVEKFHLTPVLTKNGKTWPSFKAKLPSEVESIFSRHGV